MDERRNEFKRSQCIRLSCFHLARARERAFVWVYYSYGGLFESRALARMIERLGTIWFENFWVSCIGAEGEREIKRGGIRVGWTILLLKNKMRERIFFTRNDQFFIHKCVREVNFTFNFSIQMCPNDLPCCRSKIGFHALSLLPYTCGPIYYTYIPFSALITAHYHLTCKAAISS